MAELTKPVELFNFLKKSYETIGVYEPQSCQNHLFNSKNVFIICSLAQLGTFVGIYFIFEAKQLEEYCITFFCTLSSIAGAFYLVTNIYQNENVLKLIEKFEELIAKSKLY